MKLPHTALVQVFLISISIAAMPLISVSVLCKLCVFFLFPHVFWKLLNLTHLHVLSVPWAMFFINSTHTFWPPKKFICHVKLRSE